MKWINIANCLTSGDLATRKLVSLMAAGDSEDQGTELLKTDLVEQLGAR